MVFIRGRCKRIPVLASYDGTQSSSSPDKGKGPADGGGRLPGTTADVRAVNAAFPALRISSRQPFFGPDGDGLIDLHSEGPSQGTVLVVSDGDEPTSGDSSLSAPKEPEVIEIDDEDDIQFITEFHREKNRPDYERLPPKAIYYDYSTLPVGVDEQPRAYYSDLNYACPPFRRPIVIDGIGFLNAYVRCMGKEEFCFPMHAILRCLFYWVSKAHSTLLAFPLDCNPLDHEVFAASEEDKQALSTLADYELVTYCKPSEDGLNSKWFENLVKTHLSCLVTTGSRVNGDFPSVFRPDNPTLGVSQIGHKVWSTPILQPFITHGGSLVFFSPLNACNKPVAEMVVLKEVTSQNEYDAYDLLQPSFIDQVVQLKLLHELLPEESRFRETNVMVEVLSRLDPFLPGGEDDVADEEQPQQDEGGWNWDAKWD